MQVDGLAHSSTLPLGTSIPSSRSISPTSAGPRKSATLQQPRERSRRRSSFDGRGADAVSKIRDAFKSSPRADAASPDREPTASPASGIKGLFSKKPDEPPPAPAPAPKESTIAARRAAGDSASPSPGPPALQTSGFPDTPPRPLCTPPNPSGTPVTTLTPPTPTAPKLPDANSDLATSPSSQTISHRRVRSSSSNAPSRLSTAISAPLTPHPEESRSPSGTAIAPSERPNSQTGFFSSVLSAAQNAATTLGNTISSNPLAPGAKERGGAGEPGPAAEGDEVVTSSFGGGSASGDASASDARDQRPLAIETLGSGELNFSHLGIAVDPTQDGPAMSNPPRSAAFTEHFDTSTAHAEGDRVQQLAHKDNSSVHTFSTAAGDDAPRVAPSPGRGVRGDKASVDGSVRGPADASLGNLAHRPTEAGISGERTPPTTRDWDKESAFRRSGSVRSRTDRSLRRQRGGSNATGTTVATATAASNATLSGSGVNGSVPRLTGFAVASKKRNRDFHQTFRSVPADDYLIEDYSAAFQKDILLHGRFYVSEGHICFNSNIFGYVTTLIISFDEVVSIEKKNTAMFIPNGLIVQTLHAKNVFASFTSRDSTYDLLISIWKIGHPNLRSSLNGVELAEPGGGDKTVKQEGPASEDESDDDYGQDEDVYDEDEEEEEGLGSFTEAGDGSVAGSEVVEAAGAGGKASVRKASSMAPTNGAANGAQVNGDAKGDSGEAGAGAAVVDFPGPTAHAPTECADGDTHYDKVLKDEVIHAPLGKVYNLMFGPGSGAFMSRWLVEEQKCMDLQMDDDKKGLGEDKCSRTFSYIKPLNGSIGPKQTKCVITENLDAINLDKAVSVTITTQTPDVPSGNAFSTKTKYCLMWAEGNATRLLMNCTIEWTGKSWLKGGSSKAGIEKC